MIVRLGIWAAAAVAFPLLAHASICDQVAEFARARPDKVWTSGDKALAPALVFDESRSTGADKPKVTPFEASLVRRKDVQDGISAGDGDPVFIDHLAGTDLYALSSIQGTLDCQTTVLVRAEPGHATRLIKRPVRSDVDESADICWLTSESLGRAFGQPIHAVHDMIGPDAKTAAFSLTPWTGEGWGKTCKLSLTFGADYALIERRCGDEAICTTTENRSMELSLAYNRFREDGGDGSKFAPATATPSKLQSQVKALIASQDSPETWTPDFPAFGGKPAEDRPISYSGFAMFAVNLGGREVVAAIGHEGVGWREGENTLVAFYDLKNGTLTPLAGYVIQRSLAGLAKATAR